MTEEKKARISELTRISREQALREEYLADWRRSTIETLENVYIENPDGSVTKLPKKKPKARP